MRKLKMTIGSVTIRAELFDTPTADALYEAAPFTASATPWSPPMASSAMVISEPATLSPPRASCHGGAGNRPGRFLDRPRPAR